MDKFTSKHLLFVLFGVSIVSLKTYPTLFFKNGGRDTWFVIIVGSILIIFYILFMISVFKKSQFGDIASIYKTAVGRILGRFFVILFAINIFLSLIESASVEASAMHTNMLIESPNWQFLIFLIPAGLYAVKRGKGALMVITIVSIFLIMMSGVNLAFLTAPYKHFEYLTPILKDGIHSGLWICLFQILGLYGSIAIAFPYMTEIKDQENISRWVLIGIIHIVQIEIISTTGVLMTFEIGFLNTMIYPKLLQTQLIHLFGFLEFGELFVMLQIVGGWLVKYILTLYALIKVLESGLNINKKNMGIYISILVFILSYFASNNLFFLFKLLNYYTFISLANYIVIPFLIFLIYRIRGCPKIKA